MKHTQGEWKISDSPVRKSKESSWLFKTVKTEKGLGGRGIANVFGLTKEEAEANAKVIAGAPVVLQELRNLIDAILQTDCSSLFARELFNAEQAYKLSTE